MTFTIKEKNIESMYRVLSDTEVALANISAPGKVVDVNVPATVRYEGTEYNVVQIGEHAFKNVAASSITIPSSIEVVSKHAFSDLKAKKVDVNAKVIQTLAFRKADIEEIRLGECIGDIQSFAFGDLKAGRIIWPDNYQQIPSYCFSSSSINCIMNIDNVTSVRAAAFCDTDIKELSWPSGCKAIPDKCFENSSISILENISDVRWIGARAFRRSQLKKFEWPHYCASISNGVFEDCVLLKNLCLPPQLEAIGTNAFSGTNIEVLNLPTVNNIEADAFSRMPCLRTVYYPPTQSTFISSIFEHSPLEKIVITSDCVYIHYYKLNYFIHQFPFAVIDATQCSQIILQGPGPMSTNWMNNIEKGFDTVVIINK